MIAQFNLLPDVKLQYQKSARMKRTVMVIAAATSGAFLALFILLLFGVNVIQKQHLSHLTKDIAAKNASLQAIPEIDKILTVQNQLKSLPGLHDQKPQASRLFNYLGQITPQQASISKLEVKFDNNTISITGNADSLQTVNKFVDTLKFATYSEDGVNGAKSAFTNVVLANFGRTDKTTTYQINVSYDKAIFDSQKSVTITVPNIVTTRSQTEKPSALFNTQDATQ